MNTVEIKEPPKINVNKYFKATPSNSIEIYTYITDPNSRHDGLARIVVFEGIKNHIERNFLKDNKEDIYLCSTLHRENTSSKYVSEFFGLKDSIFVKRRQSIDREVHICKIEDLKQYVEDMYNKLVVLYGYNPEGVIIEPKQQVEILEEQYIYEKKELTRLEWIKENQGRKYTGTIENKTSKLESLKNKIISVKDKIKGKGNEDGREI